MGTCQNQSVFSCIYSNKRQRQQERVHQVKPYPAVNTLFWVAFKLTPAKSHRHKPSELMKYNIQFKHARDMGSLALAHFPVGPQEAVVLLSSCTRTGRGSMRGCSQDSTGGDTSLLSSQPRGCPVCSVQLIQLQLACSGMLTRMHGLRTAWRLASKAH